MVPFLLAGSQLALRRLVLLDFDDRQSLASLAGQRGFIGRQRCLMLLEFLN